MSEIIKRRACKTSTDKIPNGGCLNCGKDTIGDDKYCKDLILSIGISISNVVSGKLPCPVCHKGKIIINVCDFWDNKLKCDVCGLTVGLCLYEARPTIRLPIPIKDFNKPHDICNCKNGVCSSFDPKSERCQEHPKDCLLNRIIHVG